MGPIQTALGRLLQERRESAGYSRTRIGELVGIKPGTIEGWELGRVARPPIHDVLRIAHFLRIPADEIQSGRLCGCRRSKSGERRAGRARKKESRAASPGRGCSATRGCLPAPRVEGRGGRCGSTRHVARTGTSLAVRVGADGVCRLHDADVDDRRRRGPGDEGRRRPYRGPRGCGRDARGEIERVILRCIECRRESAPVVAGVPISRTIRATTNRPRWRCSVRVAPSASSAASESSVTR